VSRAMWSPAERAEYDEMVRAVCLAASSTEERVELYKDHLADALQSQRFWAEDSARDAHHRGCREQLTNWLKSNRVVVAIGDRTVSKPRTIGVRRKGQGGEEFDTQVLFELIEWDELERKREDYLKQLRAYTDNTAVIDKLLALRVIVPEAGNPRDALAALGESLDTYLARVA
jgi:hypothetical protein